MSDLEFDEDKKIPFDVHVKHHSYIADKLEQKEKTDRLKEKTISTIVISSVLAIFSGLGAIIWYAITTFVHGGGK